MAEELDEDKSCTGDVEDEAVPELKDKPGKTQGTKLYVLRPRAPREGDCSKGEDCSFRHDARKRENNKRA